MIWEDFQKKRKKRRKSFEAEDLYMDKTKPDDVLIVKDIVKTFGDGKKAVDHVNINFYKDEIFALLGHNGAGKTNILEAISLLTPGKGLRSVRLSDVARRMGEDVHPLWSVAAEVQSPVGISKIGTGMVEGSERRQVRIDGRTTSKQAELGEVFRCLWLTPVQDRLFCGDPAARRRFLDRIVATFDRITPIG